MADCMAYLFRLADTCEIGKNNLMMASIRQNILI